VEKAATLEHRSEWEARWRGMKMGCCTLERWRCRLAERKSGGEGSAVESAVAEAARACGGATWGEFFKRLGASASGWADNKNYRQGQSLG
jgi:hypothetical protein